VGVEHPDIGCVNPNYARRAPKAGSAAAKNPKRVSLGPAGPRTPLGLGRRRYGNARDAAKLTYETALESILHEADGYQHQHHLAADDGALYELDRPALAGGEVHKGQLLTPVHLDRLQDSNGHYYLRLTLAGDCAHGGQFTVSYDLRKTDLNRDGHLPWRSLVANLRVIPDALVERFGEVYGQRNQIESFFSWLETCFYRKDRHASWGRDAQLLDLIAAALLHNTHAWAHLAYRHPAEAKRLVSDLAALDDASAKPANTAA
jgi:hypothetical protein